MGKIGTCDVCNKVTELQPYKHYWLCSVRCTNAFRKKIKEAELQRYYNALEFRNGLPYKKAFRVFNEVKPEDVKETDYYGYREARYIHGIKPLKQTTLRKVEMDYFVERNEIIFLRKVLTV